MDQLYYEPAAVRACFACCLCSDAPMLRRRPAIFMLPDGYPEKCPPAITHLACRFTSASGRRLGLLDKVKCRTEAARMWEEVSKAEMLHKLISLFQEMETGVQGLDSDATERICHDDDNDKENTTVDSNNEMLARFETSKGILQH
jgi:hypothetical protein